MAKKRAILPDPLKMPIMQLLLLDNDQMVFHIETKRRFNNERLSNDIVYPDEIAWIQNLIDARESLSLLLETVTVDELISYSLKRKLIVKRPGAKQSSVRMVALLLIVGLKHSPTNVWENYVLPELINQGRIQTDAHGNPDPIAVQAEKSAFSKYLDRERLKFPEIPPKNWPYFGVFP